MSYRDENQIGKTFHRQQVTNLSREIACPKNSSEKILPLTFVIDQRADARAFNRNKWTELLQSLRDALNTRWRRVSVEKPVIAAASAGAPKRAPDRRHIDSCANTVADQGNVRQPRDQLIPANLLISVSQVIRMKW